LAFFTQVSVKAWSVDFSRRQKELKTMRTPASITDQDQSTKENMVSNFFESVEPTQEIVIMNTDKGFVPETLHLKKGQNYKIFIVNVNDKEKNTSFVLDAFSEHHATYFGQQKSFNIAPKADGIYSFQCPETAQQGRIIVFSDDMNPARKPASNK
jgi:plastocyanin domain-containing protein